LKHRNAISTGGQHEIYLKYDHLPRTQWLRVLKLGGQQVCVLSAAATQDPPLSIQAQNHRGPFESAEHQRQIPIDTKMGRSFVSAAGQVEVGGEIRARNSQRADVFGRDIDPARRGRGSDEKYVLSQDEISMRRFDMLKFLSHFFTAFH
jgi:hypothetical protein